MPHKTLTTDEVAARGQAIYREHLQAQLEPVYVGKFAVIDINTGEYEIGDPHYMDAADVILARSPSAVLYIHKIGYPAAVSMGGRLRPDTP